MDVNNLALSLLTCVLLDDIFEPNLRATSVGGNSSLSLWKFVGNLRWHNLASVSELVKNNKRLAIYLDNASHCRGIKLHQIVKRVLAQ